MSKAKSKWLYVLSRAVIPGVAISGAFVLFSTDPAATVALESVKKVSTANTSEIPLSSGDDVGSVQFGQFGGFGGQFGGFGGQFGISGGGQFGVSGGNFGVTGGGQFGVTGGGQFGVTGGGQFGVSGGQFGISGGFGGFGGQFGTDSKDFEDKDELDD